MTTYIIAPLNEDRRVTRVVTSRAAYLNLMGLKWDPFLTPAAEQELAFADPHLIEEQQKIKTPLSYFVPPEVDNQSIFKSLLQSANTIVWGEPGQGKTTLRLAVSAWCRRGMRNTLAVTFTFPRDLEGGLPADVLQRQLSRQLAVDLFIQIVEHYNPLLDASAPATIDALGRFLAAAGRPLRRLVQSILERPDLDGRYGLADRWHRVDRLPVKIVDRKPHLLQLIQKIADHMTTSTHKLSGKELWQSGVETARAWGFQNIYILLDGVDTYQRENADMFALVAPFLAQSPAWEAERIYCKFFLPSSLKRTISTFGEVRNLFSFIDLRWDKEGLRSLLEKRFEAIESRRVNFNDLAHPNWHVDLAELLIAHADGSPRRLLKMISALLDAHIANIKNREIAFLDADWPMVDDEYINRLTAADWDEMVATL